MPDRGYCPGHSPPHTRVFEGGRQIDHISADDRGLAYGDGLFETMRASRGDLPWWSRHWARLERGAQRLRFSLPSEPLVRSEAERLLDGSDDVLKLRISRGRGGRGYAPSADAQPVWALSRHPAPNPLSEPVVRWCRTRLSIQPALAGIKHCNRLEQVLARDEWRDELELIDEGLMCSTEGDVVSATAANLFVQHGGQWRTPVLDRCGVEGTCREWLMEHFRVEPGRLSVTEVETADAVVLTNAVRGILQVARLGGRRWSAHPDVARWRSRLAADHPAFAPSPYRPDSMELP